MSILGQFWLSEQLIDYSFMGYIFLLLYMPDNFWLGARLYEFYLDGCWIFLYSYKYFRLLLCDTAEFLGDSLIFSNCPQELAF